nr:unnamed protein product [Digitaria exilis]
MALASSWTPAAEVMEDEIAFFDVETSVLPNRCALLEFGAVVVCPRRLVEVSCYSTLVRPADPDAVPASTTARCNGITRDTISRAPPFRDVADDIYRVLHGRVWAGHNVERFDSVIIREAFDEIGRPPPQPRGMIDTLPLLTQRFGRRAGDMKMASLANYFGLGRQRHRSLDDVRMNIDVLKYCATVLLLEASPRKVHTIENLIEGAITRSQANGTPPELSEPEAYSRSPNSLKRKWTVSPVDGATIDGHNHDPARDRASGELVVFHGDKMMLRDRNADGCRSQWLLWVS